MFGNLGLDKIVLLMVLGMFVFGPERLPGLAADAGRMLRQVRAVMLGLSEDLRAELGPEFGELDLRSLHPREFVRRHLFEDDLLADPGLGAMRADVAGSAGVPLAPHELPPVDPDCT